MSRQKVLAILGIVVVVGLMVVSVFLGVKYNAAQDELRTELAEKSENMLQIEELTAQLTDMQMQLDEIAAEKAEAEQAAILDAEAAEEREDALADELTAAKEETEIHKKALADKSDELENVQTELTAALEQLAADEETIHTAEEQISTLQTQVETLLEQIEEETLSSAELFESEKTGLAVAQPEGSSVAEDGSWLVVTLEDGRTIRMITSNGRLTIFWEGTADEAVQDVIQSIIFNK